MMPTGLNLALSVLESIPGLVQTGVSIEQLVASTLGTLHQMQLQGRDPTVAEWDAIHAQIAGLKSELDAPEIVASPGELPLPVEIVPVKSGLTPLAS